jgi:hypothetical protein
MHSFIYFIEIKLNDTLNKKNLGNRPKHLWLGIFLRLKSCGNVCLLKKPRKIIGWCNGLMDKNNAVVRNCWNSDTIVIER